MSLPAMARDWRLNFLLALGVLALYRVALISGLDLPLFFDESYYYYWSLNPDFGYFSKPPMVAMLIKASTALFGHHELGLKIGGLIVYTLTALLIYRLGRRLYDEPVGLAAGLGFMAMPIVGFNSLFISTDAPLLFFWALTLLLFLNARDSDGWGWWLATGVAAGLGLESKYTMGLLAPGLLGYLLFSSQHRRLLWDKRLWAAVIVAALVWAPNLWWNLQHEWISFRHTAEISELDRELFHPAELAAFVAAQFIVFGPLFAAGLVGRLIRPRDDERGDARRFLLWVSLPVLAVICAQALLSRAHFNWAAPAYVGLIVLVAAWLVQTRRWRLYGAAIALNLLILGALFHYHALAGLAGVELKRSNDPYSRILGWRELAAQLQPYANRYPDARLASNRRDLLAYMSFYLEPKRMQLAFWSGGDPVVRNQYQLVADMSRFADDEFLFISQEPLNQTTLSRFEQSQTLSSLRVSVYQGLQRQLYVYRLRGFRGYRDD